MQNNYPTENEVKAAPFYVYNNGYIDPNLNNNPYNLQPNLNNPEIYPNNINPQNNVNFKPNIPFNQNPQMNYQQSISISFLLINWILMGIKTWECLI